MIAIKNMRKPKACVECSMMAFGVCHASPYRTIYGLTLKPSWCPLIELPDGLYQVQGERVWKYHGKGEK